MVADSGRDMCVVDKNSSAASGGLDNQAARQADGYQWQTDSWQNIGRQTDASNTWQK